MKTILLAILSVSFLSSSCNKSSNPAGPDNGPIQPSVDLAVGNQYHWNDSYVSSGILIQDSHIDSITSDSIIDGHQYFQFSSGELLRASRDTVYQFINGTQAIYYRLDVSEGQTVEFLGYLLPVTLIEVDTIFQHAQKVVYVSNQSNSADTTMFGSFTAKFGLLSIVKKYGTNQIGHALVGVRIDTVAYGITH